jgi:hypothetical protein
MFFHLQYIHLFRPFLKYNPTASPLPSHVSPRRICSANAGAISKLMRLYKKTYNLRQICNIAVYMIHSACTIHMLNLPERTAKRDIIHGVRQLEEIAEDWPCARRTLGILSVLARKWNVEMPEEASVVLQRTDEKYGTFSTSDVPSPKRTEPSAAATPSSQASGNSPQEKPEQYSPVNNSQYRQPTPPQMPQEVQIGSISPDLLGMAGQMQQSRLSKPMSHAVSMSDALSAAASNPWTMPSQPVTNFAQAFTPSGTSQSGNGTRQVSPSSLYAIDGQDWYLKDGVNWQQNFEAWNMGGGATNGGGANGGGMADASMFMFRGMRRGEFGDGAFDSLNMGMGSLDHLPGLD